MTFLFVIRSKHVQGTAGKGKFAAQSRRLASHWGWPL